MLLNLEYEISLFKDNKFGACVTKQYIPSPFALRCYELLKQVPAGKVTTYGELAHALNTRAFQAVGQVLHKNPFAPEVPCHRVVCSNGSLGGFALGPKKKIEMLAREGVKIEDSKVADFETSLFRF